MCAGSAVERRDGDRSKAKTINVVDAISFPTLGTTNNIFLEVAATFWTCDSATAALFTYHELKN